MISGKNKEAGKDPHYFALLECMDNDGCMVCRLLERQVERIIDSLRYEKIDDFEVRRSIHQSGGFCREHALQVLEKGDPLVHAIIYSRLFEQKAEALRLEVNLIRRRGHRNRGKRLESSEGFREDGAPGCLICQAERKLEKRVLPLIPIFFAQDEAFRDAFKVSGHLCVPHLEAVFAYSKAHSEVKDIISVQIEKYAILANHLREIERKFDYRYCGEASCEEERKAWKLAVALWTGN